MDIKFKDIREYISRLDRISVCILERGIYFNYQYIERVSASFDECYLYRIGMIESEFNEEQELSLGKTEGPDAPVRWGTSNDTIEPCIELMLSKRPRSVIEEEEENGQVG